MGLAIRHALLRGSSAESQLTGQPPSRTQLLPSTQPGAEHTKQTHTHRSPARLTEGAQMSEVNEFTSQGRQFGKIDNESFIMTPNPASLELHTPPSDARGVESSTIPSRINPPGLRQRRLACCQPEEQSLRGKPFEGCMPLQPAELCWAVAN